MKRSLTLVEVLVSVALFALLCVSIYSLLRTGLAARKKIMAEQALFQNICFSLERFAKDMHNIVKFKSGDPNFPFLKGGSDNIEFIATGFDYQKNLPALHKVRYEIIGGALAKQITAVFGDSEEKRINCISGINSIRFSYFDINQKDDKQWRDSWEKYDELPFAVRLDVSWKDIRQKEHIVNKYVMLAR